MFKIIATGMYLPKNLKTNEDFYKKFGDDPLKKVFERIGHGARYYADKDESSATLAIKAGEQALKNSGLKPEDINLLIISTDTPSQLSPATAAEVQHKLGIKSAGAFDVNCACAGFVTAVDMAAKYLNGDEYKRAMVIGTYAMSKHLDHDDGNTSILFGDGAGAFIMEYSPNQGATASTLKADGSFWDFMGIYGGGNLMLTSQLVVIFSEHLHLSASTQIALLSVVPLGLLPFFVPLHVEGATLDIYGPRQAEGPLAEHVRSAIDRPQARHR